MAKIYLDLDDTDRLFLRSLVMLKSDPSLQSKEYILHNGIQQSYNDLKTKIEIETTTFLYYSFLFNTVGIQINQFEDKQLLKKLISNTANLKNLDPLGHTQVIGIAVVIEYVFFEHSCAPNVGVMWLGPVMQIKAMKNIKKGENLCCNFVDVQKDKIKRQIKLIETTIFSNCKCERCTNTSGDEGIHYEMYHHNLNYMIEKKCEMIFKKKSISQEIIGASNVVDSISRQIYKYYHPQISTNKFNIALIKMMNPNESWEQIEPFINETFKHLAVTHGVNHIVYKTLIELTDLAKKFIGQKRIEAIQIYYLTLDFAFKVEIKEA